MDDTKDNLNQLVRIRFGAEVYMDHRFFAWGQTLGQEHKDYIFRVDYKYTTHQAVSVVAFGYGLSSTVYKDERAYGCGALSVRTADLIPVEDENAELYIPLPLPKRKNEADVIVLAHQYLSDLKSTFTDSKVRKKLDIIGLALERRSNAANTHTKN